MASLSNIFGGDDSTSSNDSGASGTLLGDVGSVVGLDVSSNQENSSRDEDGNESHSSNSNDLSLDGDTDALLGGVGDIMSSADATSE